MITKFKLYESLRDKMTGKSKEEIKDKLKRKSYLYILNTIGRYDLNIDDLFTKEELDKIKTNEFWYIDDEQEMIFVDTKRMESILSVVGEGIQDVDIKSETHYHNEYQNEIFITFYDNAWGGISLKEWNRLDNILKPLEKKNGLNYYNIDTDRAMLTLRFDSEYPLEEL